jgi:mannose-6-phosphate isomerase-like protein (cupin superfamily)
MKSLFIAFVAVLLFSGCDSGHSRSGRIIAPDRTIGGIEWSLDDLTKPIAIRPLHTYEDMSVSLIRLASAEKPHTHNKHDLTVVMLSGSGILHIGDRSVPVQAGDIMEIPRGTVHWAENVGPGACEVYAIFSPPYDGKDNHPVAK